MNLLAAHRIHKRPLLTRTTKLFEWTEQLFSVNHLYPEKYVEKTVEVGNNSIWHRFKKNLMNTELSF